jgi:hypothetical protein
MSGMSHHFFSCRENLRNSLSSVHMRPGDLMIYPGPGKRNQGRTGPGQENFFHYMGQHYGLNRLIEYGTEPLPVATVVVNPAWRR